MDSIETDSLVNGRSVKRDMTLNRISHRAAENLAVGNIAIATADYGRNPLYAKAKVSTWAFDFNTIRLFHQSLERSHASLKFAIIERANVEVKIFKSFRAHSGK